MEPLSDERLQQIAADGDSCAVCLTFDCPPEHQPGCDECIFQSREGRAIIAELIASRAIVRAATEYRAVNTALDNEPPHPHPDPLALTLLVQILEQKRAALFAAVDGEKTDV
jgi:hypothetical protein